MVSVAIDLQHKLLNNSQVNVTGYQSAQPSFFVSLVLAHTKQVSVVIIGLSTPGGQTNG